MVILLIGPRYGSLLPQGISYTHAEFREAQGAGTAVLAFRIPDDPSLPSDESARLAALVTEVGGASTYDRLLPTDSLERLSARVLAALSSAKDRGELAHRFSVFQRYERFFAGQLGDTSALFNHEGPFIGREQQLERLTEFINGIDPQPSRPPAIPTPDAGEPRVSKSRWSSRDHPFPSRLSWGGHRAQFWSASPCTPHRLTRPLAQLNRDDDSGRFGQAATR